jgi:hypothetical protein
MRRYLAALAALAIAGCSGGGGAKSTIPKQVAAATGTGNVTLVFSKVRQTRSARRAPRFLDPGGTGGISIIVTSSVDDNNVYVAPPINIPGSAVSTGQATIAIPLLVGTGTFAIQEIDTNTGLPLAQTLPYPNGSFPIPETNPYTLVAGTDLSIGTVQLHGVVGGIAIIRGDPIAGVATSFTQDFGGNLNLGCTPFQQEIFVVGTDALGNITGAGSAVAGELSTAVLVPPTAVATGGSSLTPSTSVPGAYLLTWDGISQFTAVFSAGDLFGDIDTEGVNFVTGCVLL